jgi:hypothetical protein
MENQVQIHVAPRAGLDSETLDSVRTLDFSVDWGRHPDGRVFEWSPASWVVLLSVGGRLASHVGIVERDVRVDGAPMAVAGIAGVVTAPELQGRGYAHTALDRATTFIRDELHVEVALLMALEHRRSLYEGLGWQIVPNTVLCDHPEGKVQLTVPGRYVLWLPSRSSTLPPGVIDLCGPPW